MEDMPSFDFIEELAGIPVHIINVGNKKNPYLSAAPSGDRISLWNEDDKSLRQRWYIHNTNEYVMPHRYQALTLVGGNNLSGTKKYLYISPYASKGNEFEIRLSAGDYLYRTGAFISIPGTFNYQIEFVVGMYMTPTYYLTSTSSTGTGVTYLAGETSELSFWQIHPVGEFSVEELKYYNTSGSLFERKDQEIKTAITYNDSDDPMTHTFQISGTTTQESNFSVTDRISISVTESVKVGVPGIYDGQISSTQSTDKSWTFGQRESRTTAEQYTYNVTIPPHSGKKLQAYRVSYDATVGFVAKLRNNIDGKTFRVRGEWTGVTTTDLYVRVSDIDNENNVEVHRL